MEFLSADIVTFLEQYGYLAAFAAMVLAGPIGAVASGFLAGIGIFNPWIIWPLDIAADLTSDIFYYELGRHGGRHLLNKVSRWFKWSENLVGKAEWLFQKHGKKTIFIIKFTQGVGALTQFLAGVGHMSRKEFLLMNGASATIKSAILVLVGMAAGEAWQSWAHKIGNVFFAITLVITLVIVLMLIGVAIQARILKNLEKND